MEQDWLFFKILFLWKGYIFIVKIKRALMYDFYELNYIELLDHVDLWLKIIFQALAIYLKGVTYIILDGDGSMS